MDYLVDWSPQAVESLRELVSGMARDNPATATALASGLIDLSAALAGFPHLGRVYSMLGRDDVRELAAPPCRLIYHVHDDRATVTILMARHGARTEPVTGTSDSNLPSTPRPPARHFHAIAAMSRNRVIGRDHQIPWHLPEDFKWFKQLTMGHLLVMGRRTFESIGRALPGRETIVLTRSGWTHPDVRTVSGLELLSLPPDDPRKFFICGGAEVYRQALPFCGDLYLTLVKREVDGDTFFPPFEDQFELVETLRETPEFDVLHYRNRQPTNP